MDLIQSIQKRLKLDLPGNAAHMEMVPTLPKGAPIRIKHSSPPKEGAVMVLLFQENGTYKFPLIKRPNYEGVHSGQMALPGGKYEKDDQDLSHTALRETNEEIGVASETIQIIGSMSSFFVAASNFQILPVIGFVDHRPDFVPDAREVDDIVIADIFDLIDTKKRKVKEIIVGNGISLNSPYYDIEGQVVWGATAMMLSELSVILKELSENGHV